LKPALYSQIIGLTVIISLVALMAGCSPESRLGGYIHYRLNSNPTTLDPAHIVDVTGGSISAKIFNGLVKLDNDLNIVPDIAERWEIDEGRIYTFHLKKGVFFSNGRVVSADDFKFSFKRIFEPRGKSPNKWVLEKILGAREYAAGKADDIAGIEILDSYTLRLTLEKPFSPFLNLLTMTTAYVVPVEEVRRWGPDFSSHPVGTGPYILKEWKHNDRLVLARNNAYFDEKARAGGIVYRIIPEDLTAVTEFELGNLDVITIPSSEFATFKKSPKWKDLISSNKGINTYYIGFNCSRPPFDNVDLRKAVSHAIDREKMLLTFYEGRGISAKGPVADILRKWELPVIYDYNPDKARKMIEDEGYRETIINFYVTADQEVVDMAEIIQSYLNKAGLSVAIKQLEWSAYKAALNNGEADIFWIGWSADYPDPENFLFPLFHSSNHGAGGNRSRYTNKEVDRLIEAGQAAVDISERNQHYMAAERIIVEEAPWVSFWHRTDYTVRQPYLKNYKMYNIYSVDKGTEVYF
jgi:peptide/nickel transport system substrate-binding protein/oligopeptide transport system substrate-binding protein